MNRADYILWANNAITVAQRYDRKTLGKDPATSVVIEELRQQGPHAITTLSTLLQRMEQYL